MTARLNRAQGANALGFDHSYERLGPAFSTPQAPDPVSAPRLLLWTQHLAATLGWSGDPQSDAAQLAALAGNTP